MYYIVVPSSIGRSHTCDTTAPTNNWTRVTALTSISNVSPTRVITPKIVRHLTCVDYCTTHMHTHAMCAITMHLSHSSTPYTIKFTHITHTHLLRQMQNDYDSPPKANVSFRVFSFVKVSTRHVACHHEVQRGLRKTKRETRPQYLGHFQPSSGTFSRCGSKHHRWYPWLQLSQSTV